MAKGRKPAIANVARPEGWVDDVVLPIAQRVARRSKTVGRVRSSKAARTVAETRGKYYDKKYNKAYDKMEDAITRRNKTAAQDRTPKMSKEIDARSREVVMNQRKAEAARNRVSVRQTAQRYRAQYPKKK